MSTSLALACRLGAANAVQSPFRRAISAARTAGGPYLDIPDNLAQTWQDSVGTIPATIGSTVGRVTDQTGLGNNATQATAGNRPLLTTHNGKPILSFNGTSNSMQLATNPIGPTLSQPYTIIVGGVVGAVGADRTLFGDSARRVLITSTGRAACINGGQPQVAATTVFTQGQPIVLEATWDGTTQSIYVNGVLGLSSARSAPTTASTAAFIGQTGFGTAFFNGLLLPVFATGSVVPEAQRRQIGRGMAQKLGVTYA